MPTAQPNEVPAPSGVDDPRDREIAALRRSLVEAAARERALSEVLHTISRSATDLQTVLDSIADQAAALCEAPLIAIYRLEGDAVRRVAVNRGMDRSAVGEVRRLHVSSLVGRAILERTTLHVDDVFSDRWVNAVNMLNVHRFDARSLLVTPLLRDGLPVGAMRAIRTEARPFSDAHIRLFETFADQAVIAIENARLIEALQVRTQELEASSRLLAEVSRHKSEFLANMSHELRTPLNGIIGFSEILLDPAMPVDAALQQQFLENIYTSGKHLLTLINDILDLSKVEAGKLELHPAEFDLDEALQGVHAIVRALADKKQQYLTLDAPAGLGQVYHDPGRFKQVLFNLLSNAVKFTPEGGSVTTSARLDQTGEWFEVAVRDTGIGIAPADQARVFEEFQQVDSGFTRQQQGTGLGLALVRTFVRLMGGDITLQSAPGEGSTFTVRLPVRTGGVGGAPGETLG